MKYKLGDFVRFIDEKREGYITKIFDDQLVGVTGEDDFEIPTTVSNLTKVYGHDTYEEFSKNSNLIQLEDNFIHNGIILSISPDQNKSSVVHFYIINETNYQLLFSFNTNTNGKFKGELAEIINPKSYIKIFSASMSDLNIWPQFIFNIQKYTALNFPVPAYINKNYKFRGKDFALSTQKNLLLKKNGWLFKIDQEVLDVDINKLKESFQQSDFKPLVLEKPKYEIDLHIEKIKPKNENIIQVDDILNYQIEYFKNKLEAAIAHNYNSIVFIHGIGNGKLKEKIYKTLKEYKGIREVKNADYKKYGLGATEIILK